MLAGKTTSKKNLKSSHSTLTKSQPFNPEHGIFGTHKQIDNLVFS